MSEIVLGDDRQAHYITPMSRCTWPRQWAVCYLAAREAVHPTDARRSRLELDSVYVLEHDRPATRPAERYTTGKAFWQHWVGKPHTRKGPYYLFIPELGKALHLLGFWERLGTGQLKLCSDTWPIHGLVRGQTKRPKRGKLITSDPPTVVEFWLGAAHFIAVDPANYGLLGWPEGMTLVERLPGNIIVDGALCARSNITAICLCRARIADYRSRMRQMIEAWQTGEHGKWADTAASLAWNCFRKQHLKPKTILVHSHKEALALERDCYYGGEVRCFWYGNVSGQDTYVYDVNSLYPAMMHRHVMPLRLAGYTEQVSLDTLRSRCNEYIVAAQVGIRSEDVCYPVRHGNCVRYCRGRFITCLCGQELENALNRGHVYHVDRMTWYHSGNPFRDYVEYWYERKMLGNGKTQDGQAQLAKLMLNSLYGKFGQRSTTWEPSEDSPAPDEYATWWDGIDRRGQPQLWRSIGWHSERQQKLVEWGNSCPIISACITAAGRERMRTYRSWVRDDGKVYYQDTDSLHVDAETAHALLEGECVSNQIGDLHLVGKHTNCRYWGLKHYQLDNQLCYAGVPVSSTLSANGTWDATVSERLNTSLQRQPDGHIYQLQTTIVPSDCHPDGIVCGEGPVEPYMLPVGDDVFGAYGSTERFAPDQEFLRAAQARQVEQS